MNIAGSCYLNTLKPKITGDLERLRYFWLTGTCNPKKEERRSSEPLAPEQFLSAFFILMCGAALAAGLCSLEHFYFKYLRPTINKTDTAGCCALISLVSFKQNCIKLCYLRQRFFLKVCKMISCCESSSLIEGFFTLRQFISDS